MDRTLCWKKCDKCDWFFDFSFHLRQWGEDIWCWCLVIVISFMGKHLFHHFIPTTTTYKGGLGIWINMNKAIHHFVMLPLLLLTLLMQDWGCNAMKHSSGYIVSAVLSHCFVLWESLDEVLPWRQRIYCSKTSVYLSALMLTTQKCELPLLRALMKHHYITDPWPLDMLLISLWTTALRLWPHRRHFLFMFISLFYRFKNANTGEIWSAYLFILVHVFFGSSGLY